MEGVGIVDVEEVIRFANPALARITGYPAEKLVGMHLERLIPADRFAEIERQTELRRTGAASTYDTPLIRADGKARIIRVHASALGGAKAPFEGTIGLVEDVTDRLRMAERYRLLTEAAHDIIAEFGPDLRSRYVSPAVQEVLGFSQTEMDALRLEDLMDEQDLHEVITQVRADIEAGADYRTITTRVRTKAGEFVWLELSLSYIAAPGGGADRIVVVMRDVTARVAAQNEIERQRHAIEELLSENELLLREVHHRVKNDLMFVQSLLSLQAQTNHHHEVGAALADAGRRLRTVAQVYDRLHRENHAVNVDLAVVVHQLADELRSSILPEGVDLDVTVEALPVPARAGVAVATGINELVTNALKHGGRHLTAVEVSVTAERPGRLVIRVSDDGPGFASDLSVGGAAGLGLTIVKALTEQWDGTLSISNNNGAVVEMHLAFTAAEG